ncbi:MAG: hypothetical protein GY874_17195 [Desulfobacteraceae bacterium]|nr:hypothetical protein [Desulfobacteraceae bacterium]
MLSSIVILTTDILFLMTLKIIAFIAVIAIAAVGIVINESAARQFCCFLGLIAPPHSAFTATSGKTGKKGQTRR